MGVHDSIKATLDCPTCDISEVATAVDGGPFHWYDFCPVDTFDVVSEGGGKVEPTIVAATCKRCGAAANVSYRYQV